MGHRVSTPRHDSAQGNSNISSAVATSLTILLAMASASTTTVSAGGPYSSSSCRSGCCFISQHPTHYSPWHVPAASSTSAASATLTFFSSEASTITAATVPPPNSRLADVTAATVPPPNSRLGRLRQRQSHYYQSTSTLSSLLEQPPGTKRHHRGKGKSLLGNHNNGGRTDLRYATHAMEEERGEGSSSAVLDATTAGEEAANNAQDNYITSTMIGSNVTTTTNYSKRKRARMLRFLDRRLARLQRKSSTKSASTTSSSSSSLSDNNNRLMYEQQKAAWAAKYTSVSTLRKSFGKNKNRIWGDFDPTTTRRLYHTLLPRALLELRGLRDGLLLSDDEEDDGDTNKMGKKKSQRSGMRLGLSPQWQVSGDSTSITNKNSMTNNDCNNIINDPNSSYLQQELKELAPLAYQARLAAKKYARERSRLPARIGSMLYDGYRSWRAYGKWTTSGMTWEQVWNKYEEQVLREAALEEEEQGLLDGRGGLLVDEDGDGGGGLLKRWKGKGDDYVDTAATINDSLDDEELTARICLRILERSVVTNDAIDRLFLKRLVVAEDDEDEEGATATAIVAEEGVLEERRMRRNRKERIRRNKLRIQADLAAIERKFDDDIKELLRYSHLTTEVGEERRSKRQRGALFWKKLSGGTSSPTKDEKNSLLDNDDVEDAPSVETAAAVAFAGEAGTTTAAASSTASSTAATPSSESDLASAMSSMTEDSDGGQATGRKLATHEVFALRILATTKQRIAVLQNLPQLGGGGGGSEDTTAPKDK